MFGKGGWFRDYYGLKAWVTVAGICGIIVIVLSIVGLATVKWDSYQCTTTGHRIARHTEYHIATGCLVRDNRGQLIPIDNWRGNR